MNERLAKAGVVSLVGAGLGAAMALVLAVIVGRELGDDGAGLFFSTVAAFTIASNVLELGADTGLVRSMSRFVALGRRGDIRRTIWIAVVPVVTIGAIAVAALWVAAPVIFSGSDQGEVVAGLFRDVLPFALCGSLLLVVLGATRGLGTVKPFTLLWNIGVPMSRPILVGLVVVGIGSGIEAAVTAWAWPLLPALVIGSLTLRRQVQQASGGHDPAPASGTVPATPTPVLWREFWSFSAPRGVSATLEILQSWADVLLVAALRSPAEAGVYAIVSRCVTSGLLVEGAARVAVSPRISALLAHDDRAGASALQTQATSAMVLVAWPFYITLAVFGPLVLGIFGSGFARGSTALIVLCAAMMVMIAGGMVQSILLLGGLSHWQMGNKAVALIALVVGNLLLTPRFGIIGAAAAWAATIVIDTALANWQVGQRMQVSVRWRTQLLPGLLAVVTFGGVGLSLRGWLGAEIVALATHLVVAGLLYAAACWRLRHQLGLGAPAVPRVTWPAASARRAT